MLPSKMYVYSINSINVCPWSYRGSPTEEKGSSLFGKKKNSGEIGESSDQLSESESDS